MTERPRPPRPRKALGQHFLSDVRILDRIVAALDPVAGELVLEIGPGPGTLTARLLAAGLRVVAIEKDSRLAAECRMRNAECGMGDLTIVEGDALRLNWHALLEADPATPHSALRTPHSAAPHSAFRTPHWKIIGNIPYNITSPLIEKALTPPLPARIVFLVQAEVADRVAARPGTKVYGALSVGVQAVCRVERLFTVRAGAFRPPPRVQSAVVRLTPAPAPQVAAAEQRAFRTFVTACFARRRKQLRNVLAGVWDRPPDVVVGVLGRLGIEPTARPETLAPAEFAALLREGRGL
ncbi:MAG TPA: 16S rRNA (adenine(1518)-N(6)/adenine(1519)-N(6))-dimethyltransferase RsmA [Gemmatimonadales bacterium]|nr:16S rRNA (adenine(1518)-N(6)/adenine(1519)-N(6))-dimethyltransferase RsmA [Gemmatimonadales bacterium]